MFDKIISLVFMFFFFSALGWAVESTYRSLGERRIINSGFLHGPICPIYGTGALVFEVILVPLSQPFEKNWWIVLLVGIFAADSVEYITSVLMEKLFHARWWDYSDNFLNINGRICFKHSVYWAIFSFMYVYLIHPIYATASSFFSPKAKLISVCVVFVIFFFDLFLTVKAAINVQKIMKKLENLGQLVYLAGEAIKTGAGEVRDNAERFYDEIKKAIDENGEKYAEWRGDISVKYDDFKKNITLLVSGDKKDRTASETKRLFLSYRTLRKKMSDDMKMLEKEIDEIGNPDNTDTKKEEIKDKGE